VKSSQFDQLEDSPCPPSFLIEKCSQQPGREMLSETKCCGLAKIISECFTWLLRLPPKINATAHSALGGRSLDSRRSAVRQLISCGMRPKYEARQNEDKDVVLAAALTVFRKCGNQK
jgi:hypothetical protein